MALHGSVKTAEREPHNDTVIMQLRINTAVNTEQCAVDFSSFTCVGEEKTNKCVCVAAAEISLYLEA